VIAGNDQYGTRRRTIEVLADGEAVARRGAELFARAARDAVKRRGTFIAALSGGSTPQRLYELLGRDPWLSTVPWGQVQLLWGDERCVPPDSPESNYRMAREAFVARVPILPENIFRMRGEDDPAEAAVAYEMRLRELGGQTGATLLGAPVIDLVLLGTGSNGHTASLFPHSAALRVEERLAVAVEVPDLGWRLTLTVPVINAARHVVFVATGDEKAAVLARILQGPPGSDELPAQLIAPRPGRLTWLLDEAAAVRLHGRGSSRGAGRSR
jgi:6-phosphogluconolactonase